MDFSGMFSLEKSHFSSTEIELVALNNNHEQTWKCGKLEGQREGRQEERALWIFTETLNIE